MHFAGPKRVLAAIAIFAVASCAEVVTRNATPVPSERIDDTSLIVLTDTDQDGLIAAAQARGYFLLRRSELSEIGDSLLTFQIPNGTTIPEAIAEIEALQPGSTAGANHAYRLQADVSEQMTIEYADQLIGWPAQACRANGRVGMIDAGVVQTHVGFASNQIFQHDFVGGDVAPATDHGTLMADIMLKEQRLDSVQLFSANVVDPALGDGDLAGAEAIVRAVDWMMLNDVPVVNVSLAGPHNKILRRGLEAASQKGLIIVAAAGNLGPNSEPLFPAGYAFTIAATAIDSDMQVFRRAVQGEQIDVSAPGVDVLVQSQDRLRIVSGTSAAAAFVSSAVVADPSLRAAGDAEAVRRQLYQKATDLGPAGRDTVFGAGLVSARGACR